MVVKPWNVTPQVDGCRLVVPDVTVKLLPDHGHDMHLFLVRGPDLDRLVHVHPQRAATGEFSQQLPSMAAGHYLVFVDIVLDSGFPVTGTGAIDVPVLTCEPLTGDDSAWSGAAPHGDATIAELGDGTRMIWDRAAELHANVASPLRFRVENRDGTPAQLEPYMGMAGHAEIVRADGSVFAHLHPNGSVAMPALELAASGLGGPAMPAMAAMPGMDHGATSHAMPITPHDLAFPFGFPQPGAYRVFVQVKHAGQVVTGAFDARVE
jgi:hypothetical protein